MRAARNISIDALMDRLIRPLMRFDVLAFKRVGILLIDQNNGYASK